MSGNSKGEQQCGLQTESPRDKPGGHVVGEQVLVLHLQQRHQLTREANRSPDIRNSESLREHSWVQEKVKSFYKSEKTSKRDNEVGS